MSKRMDRRTFLAGSAAALVAAPAAVSQPPRDPFRVDPEQLARARASGPHPLVKGQGNDRSLYNPWSGTYVPIRDEQAKVRGRARGPAPSVEATRRLIEHRAALLKDRGRAPRQPATPGRTPGGVGQGTMFRNDKLLFNDSTGIFFVIVAPTVLGSTQTADFY